MVEEKKVKHRDAMTGALACLLGLWLGIGAVTQASGQYYQPRPWGYPYQAPQQPAAQPAPQQQPNQGAQTGYPGWPSQGGWPGARWPAPPGRQQPWGGQPQNPWGAPPEQAPQQPRGQTHWTPQGAPYGQSGQNPQSAARSAPRVEVRLADTRPFVQQPVVLTLRVLSGDNLATLTPQMPGGDVLFKKLDGPVTRMQGEEVLNEYRYAMTPLRPGNQMLPPITVTGTHRDGADFDAGAPSPLVLNVRPAQANEDYSWLPLHGLELRSFLQNAENPAAGKPVSLVVELSAVGATGAQLPSLESVIKGPDYRLYREDSAVEGQISGDGKYLLGQRTETFTLVPLHGGRVQIPGLRIGWWNVDTERWETVSTPIRQLVVAGEPGDTGRFGDLALSSGSWLLWVPLGAVFAFTVGFWVLAWLRNKRFVQVVEEETRFTLRFAGRQLRLLLIWLSPIRRLQRLRQIFVRHLPKSFRLWFCVRLVNHEDDPETWAYMLRFLANKHLGVAPQASMLRLGDQLTRIHAGADPAAMRRLMEHLDTALYGRGEIGDFAAWKRAFRSQLRPRFMAPRAPGAQGSEPRRSRLPALNP